MDPNVCLGHGQRVGRRNKIEKLLDSPLKPPEYAGQGELKNAKMRFVYKPKVFQLSNGIQKLREKKFFGFGHVQLGGIGPKIWDFGIFSDFCTFF